MKPTEITSFVDRTYLFPAIVALLSIRGNPAEKTNLILGTFDREFGDLDKKNLNTVFSGAGFNLKIQEVSRKMLVEEIGTIDAAQHFGYAAFGRLSLQKQVQERHVYTDVDVLFHQDGGKLMGSLATSERVGFVRQADAFSLSGLAWDKQNEEFFAGFIVWPEAGFRPDLSFDSPQVWKTPHSSHDQALLNMKIGQNYDRLNPLLCQLDNPSLDVSAYEPGIIHYFGNWKPWQATGLARTRCRSQNCSWTLWFEAEVEAEKLLSALGLQSWFRELQRAALRGAPKNLKILRRVLWVGRLTGTSSIAESLIRFFWKGEKHLIH